MPALIQWLTSHSETGTNLYTGSPRSKLNHHSMRLPVEDEELCRFDIRNESRRPRRIQGKMVFDIAVISILFLLLCYVLYQTRNRST